MNIEHLKDILTELEREECMDIEGGSTTSGSALIWSGSSGPSTPPISNGGC